MYLYYICILNFQYSRLVLNENARYNFITNVIEFIEKHNFEGLDLDWEVSISADFILILKNYYINTIFNLIYSILYAGKLNVIVEKHRKRKASHNLYRSCPKSSNLVAGTCQLLCRRAKWLLMPAMILLNWPNTSIGFL